MLRSILEKLGITESAPRKRAREEFVRLYPAFRARWTLLRATENDRFVVAVFYEEPELKWRPMPYKLLALSNDLSKCHELPLELDSPYRIQNYR